MSDGSPAGGKPESAWRFSFRPELQPKPKPEPKPKHEDAMYHRLPGSFGSGRR